MARKRWTHGQKLDILRELVETLAQGGSLKGVACKYGLTPPQLRKWRKNQDLMLTQKSSKKALCAGPPSSIKHLEEPLFGWAMTQRAAGIPLTYRDLQAKACHLDSNFRNISISKQYHQIRQLCKINNFVLRRTTTESSQHPQGALKEALEWLRVIRPVASAPDQQQKFVLNMDQTPIYFGMSPGQTLTLQGSKRAGDGSTSSSTERATCSLCVSAAGEFLKPMLIFKGAPTGRIATKEFPKYQAHQHISLACQENAWQDDNNMLKWIDEVLVPWCQQRAKGAPVLLLLDSFSAHHSVSTRERLAELQIQRRQLPEGCTGLVQPVVSGIEKPFKDRIRDKWWDWVIEGQDPDSPALTNATREQVAFWTWQVWSTFPQDIVRNSWRRSDLSYFPVVAEAANEQDDN